MYTSAEVELEFHNVMSLKYVKRYVASYIPLFCPVEIICCFGVIGIMVLLFPVKKLLQNT